ncbi:MAG: nucleotidyltransferase family protein [Candidatus Omnitrophota bacterium]
MKRKKAIILAAGYATRLYPLTINIPKPLLKVTKDETVIDFIVDDLVRSGSVDEIIVVTNHKFYGDFAAWARKHRRRIAVTVVDDGTHSNEDRLGAVGDLSFVIGQRRIAADCIVIGGDNLFDRGISHFLKFAMRHRFHPAMALYDLECKKEATRFGVVQLDRKNRIIGFQEKPARPKSTLAATCLYYFPWRTLSLLRVYMQDPKTSKDAPGNYIRWLLAKECVYGFVLKEGHWYDIGHLDFYKDVVAQYNKWGIQAKKEC